MSTTTFETRSASASVRRALNAIWVPALSVVLAAVGTVIAVLAAKRQGRIDATAERASLADDVTERLKLLLDESRRDIADLRERLNETRAELVAKEIRFVALELASADCEKRVKALTAQIRKLKRP